MATIYISGDPREFGSYLQTLRERLRDHGHNARTRDELEEDGKATLLQRIDDGVLKSDAVLCLMGERFGAEPPDKEREARGGERRSYTQWEYVLAKRYDKPVHVYYADDEAPLDVPNDEAKDLTKLQEGFLAEEVVAKGVACIPFRDQANLVAQVLQLETSWPKPKQVTLQNPYVGLRRFEEKDRDRFVGRDGLVQQVLSEIETHRFTALVGQSGAGKSSLVRAGVIPAWRKKHPEGKVIVFQPDRDPFASLSSALSLAGFDEGRVRLAAEPSEGMFRDLRRGSPRATDPMGLRAKPATEPWLIFVDQFEDICTRPGHSLDDQECIRRFVAALEDMVKADDAGITILVALRDDFFGCLRSYPGLYPLIDTRLIRVASPHGGELRTIIEARARANGVKVEEGLTSTMLADMDECGGGLPLLEDTLAHLWETEAQAGMPSGALRAETYRKIGGVAGCLSVRMAQYLQQKSPEQQRMVQNLMLALVGIQNFGGLVHSFSRPLPQSELLERGGKGSQELVRELISQAKVLCSAEEANPFDPIVELGHEALIRGWDALAKWLAMSREALDLRDQLAQSAKTWDRLRAGSKAQVGSAVLWRGGKLARAVECNRVDPVAKQSEFERIGGLDLLDQDFLKASVQRETRVRNWVRRIAVAACLTLLAGTGTWIFLAKQSLAAREQMRNTDLETKLGAAQAQAALGWLSRAKSAPASTDAAFYAARAVGFEGAGKPETGEATDEWFARLLPVDDWGKARASEALHLVGAAPLPFVWAAPGSAKPAAGDRGSSGGAAVAWSPDGEFFASGGPEAAVVLWKVQSGEVAKKMEGHAGAVTCLAFSPDGTLLASGGADKTVRLWKLPEGAPVAKWTGHSGWVGALAFRPDGVQLASGGYDETVKIWDVAKGEEIAAHSGDLGFVYSVAFSPDGALLAAGGERESVQIWEAEGGKARHLLKGHTRSINALAFSPKGRLLATGSSDQTVRLWDVASGTERAALTGHAAATLAWGAGGQLLATGGADHTIRVWNVEDRRQEAVLSGHAAEVTGVAWDPANTHLLSADRTGNLRLWMVPRPAASKTPTPSRDLVRYLKEGWAQFDPETGDLVWKHPAQPLAYQEALIDPASWVGILRGPEDEAAKKRRLFRAALAAKDWSAAILLASELTPEQRQEADEFFSAAARSLVEDVKDAETAGYARLRIEQARALVAWHPVWKEFDPDSAVPVETLVATVIKPPQEEPKPQAETPVTGQQPVPGADMAAGPGSAPLAAEAAPADGSPPALRAQVISPPADQLASTEPTSYVVQAGDNPFVIAKKHGITMEELIQYNKIKDPKRLQIGTELKIPPGAGIKPVEEAPPPPPPEPEDPTFTYHTVRAGENPNIIAKKYRVAEWDLMKLNAIEDPSKLQIGARLKIPKNVLKSASKTKRPSN